MVAGEQAQIKEKPPSMDPSNTTSMNERPILAFLSVITKFLVARLESLSGILTNANESASAFQLRVFQEYGNKGNMCVLTSIF